MALVPERSQKQEHLSRSINDSCVKCKNVLYHEVGETSSWPPNDDDDIPLNEEVGEVEEDIFLIYREKRLEAYT